MKSKKLKEIKQKPVKLLKKSQDSENNKFSKKLGLFDHIKHIRTEQSPDYYNNLSEENRKTFDHFMILRALSMDSNIVQEMAFLYRYFDKIPSPQFYKLLISLVPKNDRWVPWVKTKIIKHSSNLISLISKYYDISKRQANEYINIFVSTDSGLEKLTDLCLSTGLNEKEVEKLFDK